MIPFRITQILLAVLLLFSHSYSADALEIRGPEVSIEKKDLFVTFEFVLDPELVDSVRKGIAQEIIFYIDLFRFWKIWPDEFIMGERIVRTLSSDPMKKEHLSKSFDGETLRIKRFNSFESMMKGTLIFDHLEVGRMENLEEGSYYVQVTAEAPHEKIPSLVSEIFFFLPAREFKISRSSKVFNWNPSGTAGTE